jgi:hypothetical protein
MRLRIVLWESARCWALVDERNRLVTSGRRPYLQAVHDTAPAGAIRAATAGVEWDTNGKEIT